MGQGTRYRGFNPNQRAFDAAIAELEKAKKAQEEINQRTDKELEEFRATLKNLALPEEAIKKNHRGYQKFDEHPVY
ncbi:Phage endopeptidase [Streptococcus pyogenes]|nr:Phage endopeptidase [Streptococcus pyogenes]